MFTTEGQSPLQLQILHEMENCRDPIVVDRTLARVLKVYRQQQQQKNGPSLQEDDGTSLRRIDWMVTNYCKNIKNPIKMPERWPKDVRIANIHEVYLNWRRNYKRAVFDPFRRAPPVYFEREGVRVHTTAAQLNFFYFLETTGLFDYLVEHVGAIGKHHNTAMSRKKQRQKDSDKRGRQLLTPSLKGGDDSTPFLLLTGVQSTIQM